MTIEDLAKVVGNLAEEVRSGFAKMATREEVNEKIDDLAAMVVKNMASKEDVQKLASQVEDLTEKLEVVKSDVHALRLVSDSSEKSLDEHTEETGDLRVRVNKLEDKVFVT